MIRHDDAMLELATLYPLGGLETSERDTIRLHLADCSVCRQAIAASRLAAYALSVSAAEQPPADLRLRVLAIVNTPQEKVVRLRPPIWMQPGWLAAAAAVVVIVFAATWAFETSRNGPVRTWAANCSALGPTPCPVTGQVVAAGTRALRLEAHGLQMLPAGKVYQAWYIRPGGLPTPAPVFVPDASGNATVALPVTAEKGLTVAVTVEPEGGSQQPTTKPFLVASIQ